MGNGGYVGVGSACGVNGASVRGVDGVLGLGVGVDDGDTDGMGNAGAGSLGVGGVGGVGVDGLVLVRVVSGLPWTREVTCP